MNIDKIYDMYKDARAITTDSRFCPAGSLFLALRGASFDGNLFAVKALENGCAAAIVDTDPSSLDKSGKYVSRLIQTDNTLQTYKEIARRHRREYNIPVIAITGTNGKTTTKELVAAVLATTYSVLATEGNYNNDIGVPKTLLRFSGSDEIAVVEMGASHQGDIKTLAETAEPTCGLITNVGRAHLQGFGSFEGVRRTKGELYDFLALHHLFAFVNGN
ncbi:MAG: Mur ligase domain-containing protein, partial [Prevotella sp.]|nr:Mur ligase domain-containing protein [Prevotella sp.]